MPRHQITTYAILTPEWRLDLLEKIRARREARIAVGLPPDSLEPEEEEEQDGTMADTEEEDTCEADLAPPATGFAMLEALA